MILFVKNHCPACDLLKRQMASLRNLPPVQVLNIDTDPGAAAMSAQYGVRAVPSLLADGRLYPGAAAALAAMTGRR